MKLIALLTLFSWGLLSASTPKTQDENSDTQGILEVNVANLQNSKGRVLLAIYNNASAFPSTDKLAYATLSVPAQTGKTKLTLKNLKYGTYAIAVFHDENGNGKLDTRLMGIPKEDYGFSNNPKLKFGPPKFNEAAFNFSKTTSSMEITLR